MTKRLFSILALMMLMMATSLSSQAAITLKGSFDGWGDGLEMTQDADGCWIITKDFAADEEFKFYDSGTWIGAQADGDNYWITSSFLGNGTLISLNAGDAYKNLCVKVAGHYKIVLDASGNQYSMRMGVEAPVTVKPGIANGTVTVNKATAIPGETVAITVTPNAGYYIEKGNITVEKTIGGGSAQAPVIKAEGPAVGSFVDVEGNAINSVDEANTYTFSMPASPYGAMVNAEFQACTPITAAMIEAIADQTYTGEQITPAVVVKDGETTLVLDTDYTVTYGENVEAGDNAGVVTVTGKGKYTGTASVTFTIAKGVHNVIVNQDIANGTVTANPTSGVEGDVITLTITPATGYELDAVTVMNGETAVEVTADNTFIMPDADVTVNATFKAIDYTITVTQGENGTIAADKEIAHMGDVVTLTNTPNEDCVFVGYTVMNGETEVAVTDGKFTMPAGNVTVTATFRALDVTYVIKWGIGSNWETVNDIALTKGDDGKWTASNQEMAADAQFKVVKVVADGDNEPALTWLGANNVTITTAMLGQEIELGEGANIKFEKAGTYSFSFDPATKKLVVTGEIVPDKYAITIAETENGTVTADKAEATAGEKVTLTITPAEGYELDAVTVMNGETAVEVAADNTFVMPAAPVTVTVTFKAIDYTITVTQGENGTVAADKETAHVGDVVTLTNAPNEDCVFVSYTVTDAEGNPITVENNQFTMPASNVTVTATFKAYTVTYSIKWGEGADWDPVKEIAMEEDGAGKWISTQATEMTATSQFKVYKYVHDGDTFISGHWLSKDGVSISSVPATIEGLAEGGENMLIAKAGSYNFTYDPATKTLFVTGEVVPDKYAITIAETENGTVTADKAEATAGEKVTLTITPAEGYELDAVTVMNGEAAVEVAADNTFTMPAAPVTVTVTFKAIDYTITVTQGENGTVTADKETAHKGDVVTLTITPDANYEVDEITVMAGDVEVEVSEDNTFIMPASNVTVTVTFKLQLYELEGVAFTSERQWATYYNGTKNLSLPEGVKAFVANNVVDDAVDVTEINYIPAGVGVLLYSENAAEQVFTTIYTGETATYTSKLVGSDEAQEIAASAGYILYNNVFTLSEGGTVAAHRCYLPVNVTANAPRVLRIGYDGSITAIETLIATGNVASVKYVNLSGVASSMPFRGINIAVITFTDGTTRTVKVIK